MTREPCDVLLTGAEVALRFGVTPARVSIWAAKGWLPCILTPGGRRRYRAADVDALLRREEGPWAS